MKKIITYTAIMLFLLPVYLYAENMKKVLILDFINIEKKKDFQYLELSITDAVSNMLSEKFVFRKMPRDTAREIADSNYLYREDYFTKSVAMNLGLLANQDIVISGGFKIVGKRKSIIISTGVRIFDLSKKKMIKEFDVDGPADDRIWNTVEDIANRISEEARSILPTKEDWEKLGLEDAPERKPIFGNPVIGIRGGGFFYSGGWAEYFKPQQPDVGIVFSWNIPAVSENFFTQFEFYFMNHILKEGSESYVQREHMSGTTNNYFFGFFPMYKFDLSDALSFYPKIGAGWVLQITNVTGEYSSNFSRQKAEIRSPLARCSRITPRQYRSRSKFRRRAIVNLRVFNAGK